jgi:hypothetical protein
MFTGQEEKREPIPKSNAQTAPNQMQKTAPHIKKDSIMQIFKIVKTVARNQI